MAATWRKRWLPSLPLSATVFCFWLLMNDDVSAGHVALALLLALLIPPFAARLDREFARIGRLRSVPRMLGVLLWDIVQANVTVALHQLDDRALEPELDAAFLGRKRQRRDQGVAVGESRAARVTHPVARIARRHPCDVQRRTQGAGHSEDMGQVAAAQHHAAERHHGL